MNNENLTHFNEKTAREAGHRGGISSVKSRRRKKSIKQILDIILERKPDMSVAPPELQAAVAMLNGDRAADNIDSNDMLLALSLFARSLTDLATLKYMDELLGRSPQLKLRQEEAKLNRARLELEKQRAAGRIELDDVIQPEDVKTG